MSVLAIIPARAGSKGIPNKNFREIIRGESPVTLALKCARDAGCDRIILSTDRPFEAPDPLSAALAPDWWDHLQRPPELASDSAPMIDVVKHAVEYSRLLIARNPFWTGRDDPEEDDIFVLLQPTQPLRQPKHITAAIDLLQTSGADSVVSVVELPAAMRPELLCGVRDGYLEPWLAHVQSATWAMMPTRRQDALAAYQRDGTVYAFRRCSLGRRHFYGESSVPLIIDPSETCPLDTPEDWAEAERRLRERETPPLRPNLDLRG